MWQRLCGSRVPVRDGEVLRHAIAQSGIAGEEDDGEVVVGDERRWETPLDLHRGRSSPRRVEDVGVATSRTGIAVHVRLQFAIRKREAGPRDRQERLPNGADRPDSSGASVLEDGVDGSGCPLPHLRRHRVPTGHVAVRARLLRVGRVDRHVALRCARVQLGERGW